MPLLSRKNKRTAKYCCDHADGEPDAKIRKLEKPPKGYLLILNHEVFDDKTLHRPGTDVDEENLVDTFSKFNFEIDVLRDLDYKEITDLAKHLSIENFTEFSFFVLAVLSHGEEKNFVSAKDKYYEFDDTLVVPISKNTTLLGNPKIFIINACKGTERNVYLSESNEMQVDSCPTCVITEQRNIKNIPYMKEILKLYSCYEGFVSYRNPLFGCRFINSLCRHLNEQGNTSPINDIFKLVCNELTDSSSCIFVQVPILSSTFSKKFCLGDLKIPDNPN